jgi:tRNA (mo5U34)-methyltransferase
MFNDDLNKLKQVVSSINWWHIIDLGNGIVTPGHSDCHNLIKRLKLPENLKGMTVLDVGANDGGYSFEAERRGADRVVASEPYYWGNAYWQVRSKEGFNLARKVLNSKVEDIEIDVYEIIPEKIGKFDIVLFLGVLYHLKEPFTALEKVFSVTQKMLIIETAVDMLEFKEPLMKFYPGSELGGDSSNWWAPNLSCLHQMLCCVGFKRVELVFPLTEEEKKAGRCVFHAYVDAE